ncbi:MAG: 1-pyrroline-5-carboxylate dehydrogenase, partial [Propionicimonas sp.]|nr:1-pyrroline-5-carboxylate dehydrogenase [Propionicimonas sp.]
MDAVTAVPPPVNEPVKGYAPGSAERAALQAELGRQAGTTAELKAWIGGDLVDGTGEAVHEVRMPSDHSVLLGRVRQASAADASAAIDAALAARAGWAELDFDARA